MSPDAQQRTNQGVYQTGSYMPAPPPGSTGGAYPPNFDTAMQRTSSDASMTMSDANTSDVHGGQGGANTNASIENWLDDDTVPTVFRWEHGGRQVYITGTFNGWSRQIPMHRSGNDFTYIHNLKRGKHAFKFIVDDEWRFAPDQPTVADIEGRINNFIDVTDFKAYTGDRDFEKEKAAAEYGGTATDAANADDDAGTATSGGVPQPDRDGEVFSNNMPDVDDYTREPPPLPPHLRYIILNKPPQLQDTAALPVPQHVALNHLYCTAIKDNMMVLGITQRYKTKFVTTVYYSPCK
jgi:5'-AMP-activated protein kinase regulatory beta subunit